MSEDALTEIIGEGKFDMFEWGWVVEPDPNYQLSTFTCANRSYKDGGNIYANLSDSFYCDKQYDALYAQQGEQIDPAQRAETVKQMQKMVYDDAPYVDHVLLRQPRGLPVRPVHRLPAAARPGRLAAVPVRHLQLPERPAGHGGGHQDSGTGAGGDDAAAADDSGGSSAR